MEELLATESTEKAARKMMRKKKKQRQREKRKTSDTCVAKVIYTVARFTGFNHGRLKADIPALKT